MCTISHSRDIKTIVHLPPCLVKRLRVADINNFFTVHNVPKTNPEGFTTVKSTNNKKECYLDISKDHSLPAQRDNLFRPDGGDISGHRVPTLHRKKRLCEEHKTTCYFVCFRKDAGISLEKILPFLSLSHTHILGAHISLCVRGPTCHRASWQPGQSATAAADIEKAGQIVIRD
ncbi:hypothetical protein AVEN_77142-1 [Araneus ventricosus]|uniref:Uncharacterized protein n=1 Tax=Araneus ventricosus TaxID=182803 RepID=A0A4Y2W176_ARAVE|nr:hypothetical protein AVEN_59198-1 [Araneus ventricosus]GBO30311.1 hypothetical protein AVEN_77142-1 [Araneus ventricosus]